MRDAGEDPPQHIKAENGEWFVPVVIGSELSGAEADAYRLLDNRSVELGGWDEAKLGEVLQGLAAEGMDPETLGWDSEQMEYLLEQAGLAAAEAEGEDILPGIEGLEPRLRPGEVWQSGPHRILCGDSTDLDVVRDFMGGKRANLVVTSPPYWVGKEYEQEKTWEEILAFIARSARCMVEAAHPSGRIVVNTAPCGVAGTRLLGGRAETRLMLDEWANAFRELDWAMRHCRVWPKRGIIRGVAPANDMIDINWEFIAEFAPSESPWMDDYSFIATFYSVAADYRGRRRVNRPWAISCIWDLPITNDKGHPATFPVELPRRAISLYSRKDDAVFEPFLGSGTTLLAAEELGRACVGIDLDPVYCEVAIRRFEEYIIRKEKIK